MIIIIVFFNGIKALVANNKKNVISINKFNFNEDVKLIRIIYRKAEY